MEKCEWAEGHKTLWQPLQLYKQLPPLSASLLDCLLNSLLGEMGKLIS